MKEIYIKARAKINLVLNVLEKREDNYHNLESIFQKINLYDEIYIKESKRTGITIKTNIPQLNNEDNIIYKAFYELKKYRNIESIDVTINKKIPMKAGLAGGSTDCAAFILGMNKLFNLSLNPQELRNIGIKLGADVVPCYYNIPVKATGIGEIIKKIDSNSKYYVLIIKPNISFSTKEMFKKLDGQEREIKEINLKKVEYALKENNIKIIAENLYNTFEDVTEDVEIIKKIKKELLNKGALRGSYDRFWVLCFWIV